MDYIVNFLAPQNLDANKFVVWNYFHVDSGYCIYVGVVL